MRFNGKDPELAHAVLSRNGETVPGMPAMDITTVETSRGELLANVSIVQDEYTVRMNIAGRTYEEAMEARLALAAWAGSSREQLAELEPTHMPGKAYSAIVKRLSTLESRFTTVDVVFLLPRPVLHDVTERKATAQGTELTVRIGGTASTQLVITTTLTEAAVGLSMDIGGYTFFAMDGSLSAGQTVEVNMHTGALKVDGENAQSRIRYTETDFDIELLPGKHILTASAAGSMTARWKNEWL